MCNLFLKYVAPLHVKTDIIRRNHNYLYFNSLLPLFRIILNYHFGQDGINKLTNFAALNNK